jgi:hypothetical protein
MELDAIHRGIHSCSGPGTRRDGANKKQTTQRDGFSGNDNTRTTGGDDLPDGKDRANPIPKSTPRDQIDGDYAVKMAISQRPGGPPLTDATQRFWTVGDGPMFFPANLEGLQLGSYDAPVIGT